MEDQADQCRAALRLLEAADPGYGLAVTEDGGVKLSWVVGDEVVRETKIVLSLTETRAMHEAMGAALARREAAISASGQALLALLDAWDAAHPEAAALRRQGCQAVERAAGRLAGGE